MSNVGKQRPQGPAVDAPQGQSGAPASQSGVPSAPAEHVAQQQAQSGAQQQSYQFPPAKTAPHHAQGAQYGGGSRPRQHGKEYNQRRNSQSRGQGSLHNSQGQQGFSGGYKGIRPQNQHRYGTHGRGNSFQGHMQSGSFAAPRGVYSPPGGQIPLYSPAGYPAVYGGAPGPHNPQAPVVYPPFIPGGQMAAASPRAKVSLSDANGNPIDLRATVAKHHQRPSDSGVAILPPSTSTAAVAAAGTTPSPAPAASLSPSPAPAESKVESPKPTAPPNKVAMSFKEAVAARRRAKAEEEAKKAAAEGGAPSEEPEEATVSSELKPETSAETEAQPTNALAQPTEPVAKADEPIAAAAAASDATSADLSGETSKQTAQMPTADEQPKKAAWKSPTVAKLEAEKAKEEADGAKPAAASSELKDEAPKEAPKWKSPTVARLEAEKAKKEAAAASESPEPANEEAQSEKADAETTLSQPAAEESSAPSSAPANVPAEEEPKSEASEDDAVHSRQSTEGASETASDDVKTEAEEEAKEEGPTREFVFSEHLKTARRLTAEELSALEYPASAVKNKDFGTGENYIYTADFLRQFGSRAPRVYYEDIKKIIGFDYPTGGSKWGSGNVPPMGSRGPSRNASFAGKGGMGRNAGPGSMRGRNNSRRKGDRQGSRRDRDEYTSTGVPIADLPPLHKVENAWQPNFMRQKEEESTDDGRLPPEEVQRKVKSLLNKMAWENFDKIAEQMRDIALQSEKETNAITLRQVVQLTFEKAIDEPHWSAMYATFFYYLHTTNPIPDTVEDHSDPDPQKVRKGLAVVRRYLLSMSQKEFEKGWTSVQEQSSGAAVLSDEYYAALALKRRGLGLIQFVGELYKLGIISQKLLMNCIYRLSQEQPTEDIVESMARLLKTVAQKLLQNGQMVREGLIPASKDQMPGDVLLAQGLETMKQWRLTGKLPARLRFLIMDMEDLAKKGWEGAEDSAAPKTIAQVHAEAKMKEQQAEREKMMKSRQSSRRGLDFGRSSSGRGRK